MTEQTGRDEDVIGTKELASRIGVSEQTLRRMAEAGEIPGKKYGKNWRFSYTAVLEQLRRPHPTSGARHADDQENPHTS